MGERTIEETIEEEVMESIEVCDFCGRNSEEVDGHTTVFISEDGVDVEQKGVNFTISSSTFEELKTEEELERELQIAGYDDEYHLDDECMCAFKEEVQ